MDFLRQLTRVKMTLRHVLYISYLIPAARLGAYVPDILRLSIVDGDKAFVSVVILQSAEVHLSTLPFPRFTYNQVNIRTYVKDPHSGSQAVYFLKSGVTSPVISLVTRVVGIPWQHISATTEMSERNQNKRASYFVSGDWAGEFSIEVAEDPRQAAALPPFRDTESAIDYLIRPLVGCYGITGHIRRFRIFHPEVSPLFGLLEQFRFPLFQSMNLTDEIEKPHSVLLVPEAHFSIYMPPDRVKGTPT